MTLGELLRTKRQEGGWSLEQLSALTKIHIKILSAIESDSYADLPARTFTRGFIVNYIKALKLKPDEVMAQYKDFLEQKFNERRDRDQGHQGYVFEGKEIEQTRRWMVIGASIAIVFTAATLFIFKPQNHHHKEMHKEFEEEETLSAASTPSGSPAKPAATATLSAIMATQSPVSSPAPISSPMEATAAVITKSSPPPIVAASPVATAPSPGPSPLPVSSPRPAATATPAPTPAPAPEASPTPAGDAVKEDKMNKGDDLALKDVKLKIIFQAKDDVWIRYRSDDKPASILVLRKGRYLAVKAKTRLIFETPHSESLSYKIKGAYQDLSESKAEVGTDATLKEYTGSDLGTSKFPAEIPASPSH